MKMLNAWTLEIDDPAVAVAGILEQLDLQKNLRANAVGIITCSYDYVEAGMVKAVCDALPFDVLGCTTLTNAMEGQAGTMLLCLSVLTADDCRFSTACTQLLDENFEAATADAFAEARAKAGEDPGLVLAFLPMLNSIGGELVLNALDRAGGGAPIFGTLACDFDTALYSHTFTIFNGHCARDRMPLLLVSGNVTPRFVVKSTSDHNLQRQQAVITASEGSVLQEVNGMSAREYFASLGLMQGSGIEGMSSIPFVVDYNDGTQPVARAIYALRDDGSALCGGLMPKGASLAIGRMDKDDILLTAESSLEKLLAEGPCAGVIMFPCLGRNMVLGVTPFAEIEKIGERMGGKVPWHLAYSGGEVCPAYDRDGKAVNRFHNFTFIACAI